MGTCRECHVNDQVDLQGSPPIILLVEDKRAHAKLIRRSLATHRVGNHIHHVVDGEAALDYLFRRSAYSDLATGPRPHVMLLDLRLPKIDGHEVLRELRASVEFMTIPVVILTTSSAEQD